MTMRFLTARVGDGEFLAGMARGLPQGFFAAPVVVGVSGGGDSVAMLIGLHALAAESLPVGRLIVAHGRHDLRAEAGADAAFVSATAMELGLPCVVGDLRVRDLNGMRGEGLEARARRIRYAFLAETALAHGARYVAVAHTADDQAETVLHRILRGTGITGLGGMRATRELVEGVALIRPLLRLSRAVVREYLTACERSWCEDATNRDVCRARNFLRHEILPRCVAGPYPTAAAAVARLAGQAAGTAAALSSAAEFILDATATKWGDEVVVLTVDRIGRLDPLLLADVFAALWRREGWPQRDMTARHYESLAALAAAAADGSEQIIPFSLPGGVVVRLAGGRLQLVRTP